MTLPDQPEGWLLLRVLQSEHAPELLQVIDENRQHLREWMPWCDMRQTLEQVQAYVSMAQKQMEWRLGLYRLVICQGKIAGMIVLAPIDWMNKAAQVEYWLAKDFAGKGIMFAALKLVIANAFAELKLHKLIVRCAVGNQPSRALAERCGFVAEGVLKDAEWLYDHWVDHASYALVGDAD